MPVEVAVVIAMPALSDEQSTELDYSLGLTQLSWDHGMAALDDFKAMTPPDGETDKTP